MDLHNLAQEGLVNTLTNPHVEFRKTEVKVENIDFDDIRKMNEDCLENGLAKLKISFPFNCVLCSNGYSAETELKMHTKLTHPERQPSNPCQCTCETCKKVLSSEQRLKTHLKTHLTCVICKEEFETESQMLSHKKIHTSCNECEKDFNNPSKLKRHMENVHKK